MSIEHINHDRNAFLSTRQSSGCAHKLDYHFVFATKYRRKVLEGQVAVALRNAFLETCRERDWLLLALSVQGDHVHAILGLCPSDQVSAVVHDLKGSTSYQMIGLFPELRDRLGSTKLWGGGHSVETMGRSSVAQITAYLQTQDAHHAESMIEVD